MKPKIEIRTLNSNVGMVTDGWELNACDADDYASPRATALYKALGVSPDDKEYMLASRPDGRWALFGILCAGHKFAMETTSVVHKTLSLTPDVAARLDADGVNKSELVERLLREHYNMPLRPTFASKKRPA